MTRRRVVTELTLGSVFLALLWLAGHLLAPVAVQHAYFGVPYGAVWSNLIASLLCAVFVWWRLRLQAIRQHLEQLAQKARHHDEQMAEHKAQSEAAAVRHEELVAQAERHHQEQLDRLDVHATAIQAHVTAQTSPLSARLDAAQASGESQKVTLNFEGGGEPLTEALKKNIRARGRKPPEAPPGGGM